MSFKSVFESCTNVGASGLLQKESILMEVLSLFNYCIPGTFDSLRIIDNTMFS